VKNKKILILGGAGFIGYYLSKSLSINNKLVIIDDLKKNKEKNDNKFKRLIKQRNVNFINKDIKTIKTKYIPKNFDYIFDFAAILGVEKVMQKSFLTLQNNLALTIKAIEIGKKQKKLKKIFFASSSEIYDGGGKVYNQKYPSKENYPVTLSDLKHKRTVYVTSKFTGEILYINSGLPHIIGRLHNVYGPRMGFKHVIPELIKKLMSKKKNINVFSPDHSRTFCHYVDAIKIIKYLTFQPKIKNDIFNVGNPSGEISIRSLLKKISKTTKINKKVKFMKDNHNSPSRRCPDMKKIKSFINKIEFKTLDYGIREIFSELKFKLNK
tara:strand:+ start:77 stop:1048 length:972 start_codon:yes stop_codon:yes gene_type:complete